MKLSRILLLLVTTLAFCSLAHADKANSAYKRGVHAEAQLKFDQAYEDYRQAHLLKPNDAKYFAAYVRVRFYASIEHLRSGQELQTAGKLEDAVAQFQLAAQIDDTNFTAKEEARRTEELIRKQAREKEPPQKKREPLEEQAAEAAGPVELQQLTTTRTNLRMTENASVIYKTIGKLAGLNVLFDNDFKAQKVNIELNDVTLREALEALALQSKTFWQATAPNTIFVAADTPAKRKELQSTVMKAFYLKNVATPAELQEAANTLKGILDINRIQIIPTQNELVIRGTPDQMVFAQKLLEDIDKPKSEVVVDVAVLQVSKNKLLTLGAVPPTTVSIAATPNVSNGATSGSVSGTTNTGNSFTLNTLRYLNASSFIVSIPPYSFTALTNDADTKVIQKPEIWTVDNEKATLKIGDRIPIATGSFGATGGTQGYGALVNTQFQYIDVGVNIDITPHIHSDREVTLKMTLEISSVTGTQNIGGINQPTIGQRRIDLQSRLQDGDINLVGGILEDSESNSISGYPGLTKIPVLKYLFAQDDKQRQETEIIFAIMPHIVRTPEINNENLRLVDLGAGNTVTVRHTDQKKPTEQEVPPTKSVEVSHQDGKTPAADQGGKNPSQPAQVNKTDRPPAAPSPTAATPVDTANPLSQARSNENGAPPQATTSPPQ